jgi:hypothetical protein
MKWNFLYQITAASRTPDLGGYRPQIPIPSVLSSTEIVDPPPPEQNSWVRQWRGGSFRHEFYWRGISCQNKDQSRCAAQQTSQYCKLSSGINPLQGQQW